MMTTTVRPLGDHLRTWRQRRRMSQLDLALDAEISQKHLSFVESGRSMASREMVLTLAERLQVPLRERNVLLLAAGYAPVFPERSLDDPALKPARAAIDLVLKGLEPYPALAIDLGACARVLIPGRRVHGGGHAPHGRCKSLVCLSLPHPERERCPRRSLLDKV